MIRTTLILILLALAIGACSTVPSAKLRNESAQQMATAADWKKLIIPTSDFDLTAYVPELLIANKTLSIYIEGDGLAWVSRRRISLDPTPIRPIGLRLALKHSSSAAAYLARPCQFVTGLHARNCRKTHWTEGRFSTTIITAMNNAVDELKKLSGSQSLQLIGFSGGGAVATLLAAQRNDVVRLVTVAGNLDHATWTRLHRITPLSSSLNPADYWNKLVDLPQLHLVGAKDQIISKPIAESYQARFPANRRPKIKVVDGFDHACCWSQQWPELLH